MKVAGDVATYYFYHYDGLLNVTCITDADKEKKALYEYDAFGKYHYEMRLSGKRLLFSIQMTNTSSGWYMCMFRSYCSGLGRWMQRDLKIENDEDFCSFISKSPINEIDTLPEGAGLKSTPMDELVEWSIIVDGGSISSRDLIILGGR